MYKSFQKGVLGLIVFCVILFLYLHIQFHLKTSDELEIYEIEQASKDKIEEICDLRQPVLFDWDEDSEKIINSTRKDFLLDNYPAFEIKIRENIEPNNEEELYLPLPLHLSHKLFEQDKTAKYFSEANTDFLLETGAIKNMTYNDEFLRPRLVSNCYYDVLMSSSDVETPFRYDLNYRNYFIVTQGSIKVKLSPPKSSKYLYPVKDYENFEFRSPINPWSPQSKFKSDFDKIKCLELTLLPGRFLFIPAYWWYSFKFSENTSVSCFKYRTYMNNIAISPNIVLYGLQNQNVERKIAKRIDISFLNEKKDNLKDAKVSNGLQSGTIPLIEKIVDNNSSDNMLENIPDILIPKAEPESMFNDLNLSSLMNNVGISSSL